MSPSSSSEAVGAEEAMAAVAEAAACVVCDVTSLKSGGVGGMRRRVEGEGIGEGWILLLLGTTVTWGDKLTATHTLLTHSVCA